MDTKYLICIEGADGSGKTTLSKELKLYLNKVNPLDEWIYQHEPNFDSGMADQLNFVKGNPWKREFYFMLDRIRHQNILCHHNVCLDRYILSGIAYSKVFSPEVTVMAESIYSLPEFKKPDVIFLLSATPEFIIEVNNKRKETPDYNPKLTTEYIAKIQEAFISTKELIREWEIGCHTITIDGSIQDTTSKMVNILKDYNIGGKK